MDWWGRGTVEPLHSGKSSHWCTDLTSCFCYFFLLIKRRLRKWWNRCLALPLLDRYHTVSHMSNLLSSWFKLRFFCITFHLHFFTACQYRPFVLYVNVLYWLLIMISQLKIQSALVHVRYLIHVTGIKNSYTECFILVPFPLHFILV